MVIKDMKHAMTAMEAQQELSQRMMLSGSLQPGGNNTNSYSLGSNSAQTMQNIHLQQLIQQANANLQQNQSNSVNAAASHNVQNLSSMR